MTLDQNVEFIVRVDYQEIGRLRSPIDTASASFSEDGEGTRRIEEIGFEKLTDELRAQNCTDEDVVVGERVVVAGCFTST